MKLKAIIIDDETPARSFLSSLLEEYVENVEVIGTANSALEGLKLLKTVKPDLIFLDIEMPGGNGFDFLDAIERGIYKIIFTTAHKEFALNAIKYKADGYLLKPIDLDDLEDLVKGLIEIPQKNNESTNNRIAFRTQESIEYLRPEDIIRVESDGNYATVFSMNAKKLIITKNMKQMEGTLNQPFFIKPHKSHLINTNFILRFMKPDGGFFEMIDGSRVPLARRNKEAILNYLDSKLT
jgi:two-component system LytT family response regulator